VSKLTPFDENRIETNTVFFLAIAIGNADDTIDITSEAPSAFADEREALAFLKGQYEEYGIQGYVYRCEPAVGVLRGKPKIVRPPSPPATGAPQ